MNKLRWLLITQLKRAQKQKKIGGFTLIELLVAMILAVLIITPLMGFMINVLNTDRQEQAKASSEQEIQTATDYITRDLQQALYIYDATGVDAIKAQLPAVTGGFPILVFWKREFVKDTLQFTGVTGNDDSFVYSLVAYYLIKDTNTTWSSAARISRFQISDGVPSSNGNKCSPAYNTDEKYSKCPDPGFQPFNITQKGKTLQEKMNSWQKASDNYDRGKVPLVLVDFIDQTTDSTPTANCPADIPNSADPTNPIKWSKIPSDTNTKMTGFYACVISLASDNRSVAQVYLRGNAMARLSNVASQIVYNSNKSTYFPQINVRVQGHSFIFSK